MSRIEKDEADMNGNYHIKESNNEGINEIFSKLTAQERKIVELILEGKSNKEIASVLFIDLCTVKTHINNIYKKIGINKRSNIFNMTG